MAKTIQDQLAEKIKAQYPGAEVKKVNQDNYLDIHLPGVHPKRGTHLFFNTASGVIKVGFYCREEEFTQEILDKSPELESYSQGIHPKGNPEWKTVDAACAAAFFFVESLSGKAMPARAAGTGIGGSSLLQRIKAAYPKCSVNEEKGYASFTFKAAFLYELRIQKGSIRLLAANYPQKASVAKSLELIAQHQLAQKSVQDRYPLLVEPGKVSPDKLTVRIEIPFQASDLQNEAFISQVIACCEQFHSTLMPLINGFQSQPVGKLQEVMSDGSAPKPSGMEKETANKESAPVPAQEEDELSMFDLTDFDAEGRPIGMKKAPEETPKKEVEKPELDLNTFDLATFGLEEESAPKTPSPGAGKGKPADLSQFDETDRCLDDPMAFLTCVQQVRNYYLGLSPKSNTYRGVYEETLREYTKAAIVPRITNEMLRFAHEDGNLIEPLLLGPMLQAEEIYDKSYTNHKDYICGLGKVISDLMAHCNVGLFLDTLEFFMYLGDMLEEKESHNGSLAPQDRYFPLFLMLKARPELDVDNIEEVLKKNAHTRFTKYGVEVNALLLKASGNFNQLSNEEKLGLILYDFILWDEPDAGLDIKLIDKNAARAIFTLITQNASLGEKLVGGFKDNASFEIFQFFNVEFNRAGFHAFCLSRWKELSSEWNPLKLQLLLDRVKRDFHISTYTNNPVLKDYLKIFEGVRVLDLSEVTTSELAEFMEKEEKDVHEPDSPKRQKALPKGKGKKKSQVHDEPDKSLDIPSLMHSILFVILQVGWKFDNYTPEEIADIKSTAVSLGDWFDMDQDECLEALDETLDLLKNCKTTFSIKEISNSMIELCLHIHRNVTNEASREDIIRFMNDRANADGKLTEEEKTDLVVFSGAIQFGDLFYGEE
jgi:hypothetical protein